MQIDGAGKTEFTKQSKVKLDLYFTLQEKRKQRYTKIKKQRSSVKGKTVQLKQIEDGDNGGSGQWWAIEVDSGHDPT